MLAILKEHLDAIVKLFEAGEFAAAEKKANHCLELFPNNAQVLFLLGAAQQKQGKVQQALTHLTRAHQLDSQHISIINACALCYQLTQQNDLALEMMQKAHALAPSDADVLANLANAYERLGHYQDALKYYDCAISIDASHQLAWQNRGLVAYTLLGKAAWLKSNLLAYERFPHSLAIMSNLIRAYIALFKYDDALTVCDLALKLDDEDSNILFYKGLVLSILAEFQYAKHYFAQAQINNPNIIQEMMPQYRHMHEAFSVELNPKIFYFEARFGEQEACFWHYRSDYTVALENAILDIHIDYTVRHYVLAFQSNSLNLKPLLKKRLMQGLAEMVQDYVWVMGASPYPLSKRKKNKIRLAYLSADFRQHPLAVLMKKVFEQHNKDEFEIYAYALHGNADEANEYRQCIRNACNVFVDVQSYTLSALADKVVADEIDILVDLGGFTTHAKPELFALQPAPMQISYLGFIATLGADYMDYAIVDHMVVSDELLQDWHEKTIRLPNCMLVYDTDINNEETTLTRQQFALPQDAIVLCSFNANYKIEPEIFNVWMRILEAVPHSVLWLLTQNQEAKENLWIEAEHLKIDRSRLIFTEKMPMQQHVQRYQLADLFLDTHYYNAHTTALDAVWQGLPVITYMGQTSSSRIAASILHSLEMPELITDSFKAYEELVIYYATQYDARIEMRDKLKAKRYSAPLFDVKTRVKEIESAYKTAWQRHLDGLSPDTIDPPKLAKS